MTAIAVAEWTDERKDLIRRTVATDLNDLEFDMFTEVCKRTGLDPVAKQIYGLIRYTKKSGRKLSIQTSIDGFRLIAERTGQYYGQTKVEWLHSVDKETGQGRWLDFWAEDKAPLGARVGVWRANFPEALYGYARFKSYQADGPLWYSMPEVMIAKCAEALALRKAFPQELSGLYTTDEMEQADREPVQAEVVEKPQDNRLKPIAGRDKLVAEEGPQERAVRARAVVAQLTTRAASANNLEDQLRASIKQPTDPGDYVIRGNTKLNGMALRTLSNEQLAWLSKNAAHGPLKQAAEAHLERRINEETQVGERPLRVGGVVRGDDGAYTQEMTEQYTRQQYEPRVEYDENGDPLDAA